MQVTRPVSFRRSIFDSFVKAFVDLVVPARKGSHKVHRLEACNVFHHIPEDCHQRARFLQLRGRLGRPFRVRPFIMESEARGETETCETFRYRWTRPLPRCAAVEIEPRVGSLTFR